MNQEEIEQALHEMKKEVEATDIDAAFEEGGVLDKKKIMHEMLAHQVVISAYAKKAAAEGLSMDIIEVPNEVKKAMFYQMFNVVKLQEIEAKEAHDRVNALAKQVEQLIEGYNKQNGVIEILSEAILQNPNA